MLAGSGDVTGIHEELAPVREVAGEPEVGGFGVVQNRHQLILRDAALQQRRAQEDIQEAMHDAAGTLILVRERMPGAYRMVKSGRGLQRDAIGLAQD